MSQAARILAQLEKLAAKRRFSADAICVGPKGERFEPQYKAIKSRAKYKNYFCTRRVGKSHGIAVEMLEETLTGPPGTVVYVGMTLKSAKRIVWPVLKQLNRDFKLGGRVRDNEGVMTFPAETGCDRVIYIGGCKDKSDIDRLRGLQKCKAWFLDEMQSVPERCIMPLIEEAVSPSLLDCGGRLVVSGTPGPLEVGYFHRITAGDLASEWESHSWTWRDNPWNEPGRNRDEMEAEVLKRNGWTRDTPAFRREYLGEWASDPDSLIFRYDRATNDYRELPRLTEYVLGVDFGTKDATAIALLGWGPDSDVLYLVEEWSGRDAEALISNIALKIASFQSRYPVNRVVCDAGALGSGWAAEIAHQTGIQMHAAKKNDRWGNIQFVNDALRRGKLLARADSEFAGDCLMLQWDLDAKAKGLFKESSAYHGDMSDAVLYGFMDCYHRLYEAPKAKPVDAGERYEQELEERCARRAGLSWWESESDAA